VRGPSSGSGFCAPRRLKHRPPCNTIRECFLSGAYLLSCCVQPVLHFFAAANAPWPPPPHRPLQCQCQCRYPLGSFTHALPVSTAQRRARSTQRPRPSPSPTTHDARRPNCAYLLPTATVVSSLCCHAPGSRLLLSLPRSRPRVTSLVRLPRLACSAHRLAGKSLTLTGPPAAG
jgi:hypothetical protein